LIKVNGASPLLNKKKEISVMHKNIYKLLLLPLCWLLAVPVWAQDRSDTAKAEMADTFRADGKIYVVVAVVVTILLGLILYVVRLDRKITKLEKEAK
jgi:hypothetical protein